LLAVDLAASKKTFVDERAMFGKFKEKIDYTKAFDSWFETENNGLEDKVRGFLKNINKKVDDDGFASDRSHQDLNAKHKESQKDELSDPEDDD